MRGKRRIVVTGMGVVSPIGSDLFEFTESLRRGVSGIRYLPSAFADGVDAKIGAILQDFSLDETLLQRYGVPEILAHATLKCVNRMSLGIQASVAASLQAWLQAGGPEWNLDPRRVGVVVGGSNISPRLQYEQYEKFRLAPAYFNPRYAYQYLDTLQVGVLSEILGILGEGFTVGGASASGNVAIVKARQAICSGDLDACVVVGAMADLSPMELQSFFNIGALAGKRFRDQPEKACRPFDAQHEGFVFGQAAGCMVLESLDSAERRRAEPLAEIAGAAFLLDANHLPDPSAEGEAMVMSGALRQAGIDPEQVDYLNAHGTASPLGDATEIKAIKQVFGEGVDRLWINSTKGFTGHCLYSAGVVEAIATVMQMREGFLHPNSNLDEPIDPDCRFCGAMSETTQARVALSNSFGFGGINTSIVLSKGIQ